MVVEQPNAVDMINKPSAFLRCSVNLDHIKTVTLIPVIGTAPVIAGDHEITELSFVNAAKPSAERREILVLLDFNEHKRIARPFIGDDVDFDPEKALAMPSYLFAIAAMEEENLDETLDFIQSKWFNNKK